MKGLLFKSKPKTPVELVRQTRDLLMYTQRNSDSRESKREEKMMELGKSIRELKCVLYGNGQSEPLSESCSQLTQEFFREDTLRLLINILPKLSLEACKDATQVVANLQRQQVQSRLIACDYLEANIDLMEVLVAGHENTEGFALWYNAKGMHSTPECCKESSKSIQIEAFHVFKLFVANKSKPSDIVNILVANRSKLLRLFADFKTDKEDVQFEADKALVVKEIAAIETKELS